MANLWWTVLVLVIIQQVIAVERDCSDLDKLKSCNECIRCGGHWCKNKEETQRCSRLAYDSWCPRDQEVLTFISSSQEDGTELSPRYQTLTLKVGNEENFDVIYSSQKDNPETELVVNSTQSSNYVVSNSTSCSAGTCTTSIYAMPMVGFCGLDSSPSEFFNIKLSVEGIKEEAELKIYVPCACSFNDKIEENVISCNGRGNAVDGVCICEKRWTGKFCEKPVCEDKRGDVPCMDSARDHGECSGNGVCGLCDKCECFHNREGSQYFDKDNYCADICMTTNDCDVCFLQPHGRCKDCHFPLYKQNYNSSVLDQKDYFGRKMWIKCNVTIKELYLEYIVMRGDKDETFFMILESASEGQVGAVGVTVPIVLGVIAIVAALAVTAGYIMWKNRTPAVPLGDSMYQNIDAEDCTGENPLYKPPTSSFKNPTYGKW